MKRPVQLVKYIVNEAPLEVCLPRGTAVESEVKRSQSSRNCSLDMCHTFFFLNVEEKHPYTHQYDEQTSPKPKALKVFYFCYRKRKKKKKL